MQKLLVYCLCFTLLVSIVLCQKRKSASVEGVKRTGSRTQKTAPEGWKVVDLEDFSFLLPKSMIDQKARGIDSSVWNFEDNEMEFYIDSGMYRVSFDYDTDYFENEKKWINKDGVKGQLFRINFNKPKSLKENIDISEERKQKPFLNAIVFYRGKNYYSSFWINYKNPEQREIAEKILYSIK